MRVLSLLILFFIGSHLAFGQKPKENRKPVQTPADSSQTVIPVCDSLQKQLAVAQDAIIQLRKDTAEWAKRFNAAQNSIQSLESQIETLKTHSNNIQKNKATIESALTGKINSLQNSLDSLSEVQQDSLAEQAKLRQKIKEQEGEIARLKKSESELRAKSGDSEAIATELAEDLRKETSAFLIIGNPADPASAPKAETYISRASKLGNLTPAQSKQELQGLTPRLEAFRNAALVFSEAFQTLQNDYDSTAVNASINKLNKLSGLKDNAHFAREKKNILHLLQNYCSCYQNAYNYFDHLLNQEVVLKERDFSDFENFSYIKTSPSIPIVASYPYIKNQIEQLKATCKKSNWTYKLKENIFREVTCPNPK